MNVDFRFTMVADQLTMLALLLRVVLALPLETIGGEEVVFVAVVLVEAAFLERHQQERVAVRRDEALIPNGGIEG